MIKDYKEELLAGLGIYELRELARHMGVSSPTTKKREQLEKEIIELSKSQRVHVEDGKAKRGRPPKSLKKLDGIIDIFTPKGLSEISLNKKIDNKISDYFEFNQNTFEKNVESVEGWLRKTNSEKYYFRFNSNYEKIVLVPLHFVQKFSLVEGDKIKGDVRKVSTQEYYVLENLLSINNNQPDTNRNFEQINDQISLEKMPIEGLNEVKEGDNILYVYENFKDGISKMKQIYLPLTKNYKVLVFAPNITVYTKLLIEKDFEGELFYSLIEDHAHSLYDALINLNNHIEVCINQNQKVIVVLYDLFGLIKGLETAFTLETEKSTYQESYEALKHVKKLFNSGKVLSNGASVTVLGTCLAHETTNSFYQTDLIKDADKIFNI